MNRFLKNSKAYKDFLFWTNIKKQLLVLQKELRDANKPTTPSNVAFEAFMKQMFVYTPLKLAYDSRFKEKEKPKFWMTINWAIDEVDQIINTLVMEIKQIEKIAARKIIWGDKPIEQIKSRKTIWKK